MKKLILSSTFFFAGAFALLAQGLVDFSNAPWEAWPEATPPDRLIYVGESIATGVPVSDASWTAALFENRGGTWTKLGDSVPFFGAGLDGILSSDLIQRVLAVPALTATQLRISVYDGAGLETRVTEGNNVFPFTQLVSTPIASPSDTVMREMRAFSVVPIPEPSTIALGVLGLGALLLFRRRK